MRANKRGKWGGICEWAGNGPPQPGNGWGIRGSLQYPIPLRAGGAPQHSHFLPQPPKRVSDLALSLGNAGDHKHQPRRCIRSSRPRLNKIPKNPVSTPNVINPPETVTNPLRTGNNSTIYRTNPPLYITRTKRASGPSRFLSSSVQSKTAGARPEKLTTEGAPHLDFEMGETTTASPVVALAFALPQDRAQA